MFPRELFVRICSFIMFCWTVFLVYCLFEYVLSFFCFLFICSFILFVRLCFLMNCLFEYVPSLCFVGLYSSYIVCSNMFFLFLFFVHMFLHIVCSTMFPHELFVRICSFIMFCWTVFLVYCLLDYVPSFFLFDYMFLHIVCPTGSFIFLEQHIRYCHKIWGFLSPLSILHAWLPQKDNSLEYGLDVIKFPVIRNHENVHLSIDWPDAINHNPTPLFDLMGLYVGKVFQKFLVVGMSKSPVAI